MSCYALLNILLTVDTLLVSIRKRVVNPVLCRKKISTLSKC